MTKLVTLEFFRGSLRFSSGHFTIFSATERERLHGHNYYLEASIQAHMGEPGITFNYEIFRDYLSNLCNQLHLYFLIPTQSPYLIINEIGSNYEVIYNHEKLIFPKSDTLLLSLANTTLEELSQWFVEQLVKDSVFIQQHRIKAITIKCFNGSEHSASAEWKLEDISPKTQLNLL